MSDKQGNYGQMGGDLNEGEMQDFGTQAESWQEDTLPPDDFSDHGEAAEPHVEEMAALEAEEAAENSAEESKKKTKWIPVVVAVAAIGFVGTMLYLQYGDGFIKTLSPEKEFLSAASGDVSAPALAPTATTNSNFSEANLYGQNSQSGAATTPALSSEPLTATVPPQEQTASTESVAAPAPETVANAPTPAVAPVEATPAPSVAAVVPPAPVATPVPVVAPVPPAVAEDAAKLEALNTRVETLQRTIEQLTQQVSHLSSAVTNIQAAGTIIPAAAGEATKPQEVSVAVTEEKVVTKKTAPRKEKATAKKTTASKAKTTKAPAKTGSWVLRAATAESAWVSKSADSPELRQVEVGQTLPGIGKVRAIRQVGESWEIVGSSGTIR